MITELKDLTSFRWATVTTVSPLAIQLDGDTAPLLLVPESLIDPLSLVVDDRVRVELSERKVVIHGVANGSALGLPGEIKLTAAATAPARWSFCRGQSLLRASYPALFTAIGTTYGAVDGTHFNLPNIQGKGVVGYDSSQVEFDTLGETGGAKTHTLTNAELPDISINIKRMDGDANDYLGGSSAAYGITTPWASGGTQYNISKTQGGGGSHNNLPPYIVLNYIIKL